MEKTKKSLKLMSKVTFKSVPSVKNEITRYREYAKFALRKNKRINIRVSEIDIVHI